MKVSSKSATHPRLQTYLTVALGSGLVATQSDAAVSMTFYGTGNGTSSTDVGPASGPAWPGESLDFVLVYNSTSKAYLSAVGHAGFGSEGTAFEFGFDNYGGGNYGASGAFSDGTFDLTPSSAVTGPLEFRSGTSSNWFNGADSGVNYARVRFDGETEYDTVVMFNFSAGGINSILGFARDEGQDLSITDAVAAGLAPQGASAVPEPASNLALLALGASGLLLRRRQQRAT